jgi:hypothetical protein
MSNLALKEKLDAAAKNWGSNPDYKTINPATIASDLKGIFKIADAATMTAMVQDKIEEISNVNGRPRFAGRVRLALQSLTA